MAIAVQDLLTEKSRKFGSSEESISFQQIFLDCMNYVLGDIDNLLGITTTRVAAMSESVDLDEQTYRTAISFGLDYYISNQGEWTIKTSATLEAEWERKLKQLHMNYLKTLTLSPKFGDPDE
jgi:hypothetical protein